MCICVCMSVHVCVGIIYASYMYAGIWEHVYMCVCVCAIYTFVWVHAYMIEGVGVCVHECVYMFV